MQIVYYYFTLSRYRCGECSIYRRKCRIFKYFLVWDVGVNFPTRRKRNLPGWYENPTRWTGKYVALAWIYINTWMTQKHRNGWVTFKCQETLSNIALARKASFTVDNRTQYTKLQVDNTVKNQIYPKKSEYISLNSLFDMMVQSNSPTFTETRIATNIRHEKRTDMQNN